MRKGSGELNAFFGIIGDFLKKYILNPFANFSWKDGLDILFLAVMLYGIYLFFRGRRAGKLAAGLAVIFLLYAFSGILGLRAVHQIISGIVPFSVILLAIIFQPELRAALEKLGNTPFGLFSTSNPEQAMLANTVNEVVEAACHIAMTQKDGALIVIERSTKLGDYYLEKGLRLDAQVSSDLLCNIFVDRSPMHDGAVIIANNRVVVAGSKLPLSVNEEVVAGMGTRHRSAVGITEVSDCVVVVVSEERHLISIANNGQIKRDYYRSPEDLKNEASMKTIQNNLRNDLFLILAGVNFDEYLDKEERRRQAKNITQSRRFRKGRKVGNHSKHVGDGHGDEANRVAGRLLPEDEVVELDVPSASVAADALHETEPVSDADITKTALPTDSQTSDSIAADAE